MQNTAASASSSSTYQVDVRPYRTARAPPKPIGLGVVSAPSTVACRRTSTSSRAAQVGPPPCRSRLAKSCRVVALFLPDVASKQGRPARGAGLGEREHAESDATETSKRQSNEPGRMQGRAGSARPVAGFQRGVRTFILNVLKGATPFSKLRA